MPIYSKEMGGTVVLHLNSMQRQKKFARTCLTFISLSVVCTATTILAIIGLDGDRKVYNFTTMTFFLVTGLSCLVMLAFLISMIRKSFTDELN